MTAKEFLLENNKDFKNLTELFGEIGYDYEWKGEESRNRWWNEYFCVQEINGKLIGYNWAEANRDESIFDLGWDFDEDSVCFVEKKEITIFTYEPIKETEEITK